MRPTRALTLAFLAAATALPAVPAHADPTPPPAGIQVLIPADRSVTITLTITITLPAATPADPNPAPQVNVRPAPPGPGQVPAILPAPSSPTQPPVTTAPATTTSPAGPAPTSSTTPSAAVTSSPAQETTPTQPGGANPTTALPPTHSPDQSPTGAVEELPSPTRKPDSSATAAPLTADPSTSTTRPGLAEPSSAPIAPRPIAPASAPAPQPSPAPISTGTFGPYPTFGTDAPFKKDVTAAPVAPDSDAIMANLLGQIRGNWDGNAGINLGAYSAGYAIADADTPRQDVRFDDCQGKGWTPQGLLDGPAYFRGVPIPPAAVAAPGGDGHLAIWQPSTDTLWEFWVAAKHGDTWQACWGGRIDNVSHSNGTYPFPYGVSASGLTSTGSMLTLAEGRGGRIEHALAIGVIEARVGHVAPANRDDGISTNPAAPQEGMRLRLDADVNVDALPANDLVKEMARAAQRYGILIVDKSGAVAFMGEGGERVNALAGGGDIWADMLKARGADLAAPMAGFPWEKVRVVEG